MFECFMIYGCADLDPIGLGFDLSACIFALLVASRDFEGLDLKFRSAGFSLLIILLGSAVHFHQSLLLYWFGLSPNSLKPPRLETVINFHSMISLLDDTVDTSVIWVKQGPPDFRPRSHGRLSPPCFQGP